MIVTPATDLWAEYGVPLGQVIDVPDASRYVPILFGGSPWHWLLYLSQDEAAELERDGWLLKRLFVFQFGGGDLVGFSLGAVPIGAPTVVRDIARPVVWAATTPVILRLTRKTWERE